MLQQLVVLFQLDLDKVLLLMLVLVLLVLLVVDFLLVGLAHVT